jgi:hypothetical protein
MSIERSRKFFAVAGVTLAALSLAACSEPSDPEVAAATEPSSGAVACNRQCLIDATDAYVAAMVAHDVSQAPLSDEIVFVENIAKMRPGEGLWKSIVEGPSSFAIHVPDETNQTVGYLAMMTYRGPPQAPQGSSPEQRAELGPGCESAAGAAAKRAAPAWSTRGNHTPRLTAPHAPPTLSAARTGAPPVRGKGMLPPRSRTAERVLHLSPA